MAKAVAISVPVHSLSLAVISDRSSREISVVPLAGVKAGVLVGSFFGSTTCFYLDFSRMQIKTTRPVIARMLSKAHTKPSQTA